MLSFRDVHTKMRIVSVTDKGNYAQIKGKTGRKDKDSETWYNSTWNFINFVGDGYRNISDLVERLDQTEQYNNGDSKEGVWIVLRSVGLENASWVDKDGKTCYPKNYRMTVFAWSFPDDDSSGGLDRPPVVADDVDDDEMPF